MSTCTRPGCRKKAVYEFTLSRLASIGARPLQRWLLCSDDRDLAQAGLELAWESEGAAVAPKSPSRPRVQNAHAELQAQLDNEDGQLRDQVAHSETSSEEPKDAIVPEPLLAKRGRPVARPTPPEQALD